MNDDYLDEDELEQEEGGYLLPDSSNDDESISSTGPIDSQVYEGKLSQTEISLIEAYNKIAACKDDVEEATMIVVSNIPKHTSKSTQAMIIRQLWNRQGHSRFQGTRYTPTSLMTGAEVDAALNGESDGGYNEDVYNRNKEIIARFIEYLATRDLSRDSKVSKAKKQRLIPAFIIYLFSSGAFGYILNCPTMPPEYQELIDKALKEINKTRFGLVEELALEYEKAGRPKVAERVRHDGIGWFSRQPVEIYNAAHNRDLELTMEDIAIYRKYRAKFVNTTNSITQEVISDYIYVIQDLRKGTYQKLKDKTRAEAISDAKKEFERFAKTHGTKEEQDAVSNILF